MPAPELLKQQPEDCKISPEGIILSCGLARAMQTMQTRAEVEILENPELDPERDDNFDDGTERIQRGYDRLIA